MNLARSQSTVNVQLTPMQLPEGNPVTAIAGSSGWQWEGRDREVQASSLRLSPDEPSEMLIQVVNTGDRPLCLQLRLTADFPESWCHWRWGGGEGESLQPGQALTSPELSAGERMSAVLYFDLSQTSDADFFERRDSVQPGGALQLNYRAQIQIYRLEPGKTNQLPLVSSKNFNLYLRPHSLYPTFLPAIYREVDFIGRLLKIFEQSFEPVVDNLQGLWANLDPRTAPEALLPFLAHWVGWPSQVPWDLPQQRQLIQRAMEIYRWRGTRRGLRLYLHLYTGLPILTEQNQLDERYIQITESFQRGFHLGQARLGEDALLSGGRPFHFSITLRSPQPDRLDEALIRSIIDQERPACCTYDLTIVQFWPDPPDSEASSSSKPPALAPSTSEPVVLDSLELGEQTPIVLEVPEPELPEPEPPDLEQPPPS